MNRQRASERSHFIVLSLVFHKIIAYAKHIHTHIFLIFSTILIIFLMLYDKVLSKERDDDTFIKRHSVCWHMPNELTIVLCSM